MTTQQSDKLKSEYVSDPAAWVACSYRALYNGEAEGAKAGDLIPVIAMKASLGNPQVHVITAEGRAFLAPRKNIVNA